MKEIKRLKIGRRCYEVKHQYLAKEYGLVDLTQGVITIDETQPPFEVVETTIHEILHAVWAGRRLPERVGEERAVTTLAQGLAVVFRDNPGLLRYIESLIVNER